MIQVDIPGAFAAGQIFAFLSKEYLKNEEHKLTHRLMGPVGWYFSLMYAPVGLFLLIGWPAWEGMFWWKWVEEPAFHPPTAFFYIGFYFAMILIGHASYVFAHSLYRKGEDKTVKILVIVGVVLTLLPFVLWPFTWSHVGTYDQYHSVPKATTPMFSTPSFLYSWMAVMGYFVMASIVFGIGLRKFSLKLSQHS